MSTQSLGFGLQMLLTFSAQLAIQCGYGARAAL